MSRKKPTITCLLCNREMTAFGLGSHLKGSHNMDITQYNKLFGLEEERPKKFCKFCSKEIIFYKPGTKKFCNENCRNLFYKKEQIEKSKIKYPDDSEYVECKICGFRASSLVTHVTKFHGYKSVEDYKIEFALEHENIISKTLSKKFSESSSGERNVWYNHGGKLSPFSKHNPRITEDQRLENIKKVHNTLDETNGYNTRLEFWINKGYTLEEAEAKLKDRQQTFTLEKCISRFGEEKGYIVWKKRQEKWVETINSKSPEDLENFHRSKFHGGGYSKVSQKLFWELYDHIKNDFSEIYFATRTKEPRRNTEFCVSRGNKRKSFLDFYIKDIDVWIEFDGYYYHGEKYDVQKIKDNEKQRETDILQNNPSLKLLRIKEVDFKNNKNDVVKRCLDFIYSNR